MATYTANVPVSGQSLGSSRPIINSNFSAIQTTFDENHVDFNDSHAGAHKHADLLSQASNPNPATGLVSHYSKDVSGVTEWFFQKENSGQAIQMSNGTVSVGSSGYTFLPGGLILQWGSTNLTAVVTFPKVFPNSVFSVQFTGISSSSAISSLTAWIQGSPTTSGFFPKAFYQGAGSVSATYIAIGN